MYPTDDFDPSAYMAVPKLDAASQIALCRQLLAAAPADLPRPAEGCKRALLEATRALEDGYQLAQREDDSPLKRPIDQRTDNTWSCLKSRLDPYTWLDEDRFAEASRAQAIAHKLFPTGLGFTQLEYGAQWAEASWRIRLIAEEKLEPELRRLCGDVFIDELLHWHAEYGKMVGVVPVRRGSPQAGEEAVRQSLGTLRRQAIQAVVAWQAQLVALYLAGHKGARAALRPTDDYRDKIAAAAPPSAPKDPQPPILPSPPLSAPPPA